LEAVLQQTVSADGILIVDYASTDGFAELKFPQIVTVIHNQLNLRPSGALTTGIEYARAHGYRRTICCFQPAFPASKQTPTASLPASVTRAKLRRSTARPSLPVR
jgi:hypothetical protein